MTAAFLPPVVLDVAETANGATVTILRDSPYRVELDEDEVTITLDRLQVVELIDRGPLASTPSPCRPLPYRGHPRTGHRPGPAVTPNPARHRNDSGTPRKAPMMDDDQFNDLFNGINCELEMMRGRIVAEDELAVAHEQGLADGGHWGADSERFAEALATVAAYRAFPPRKWWAPPACDGEA